MKTIFIIFTSALLLSCSNKAPETALNVANLKLEHVRDIPFELPDSVQLGRVHQMELSQTNELWSFSDPIHQQIIITDNNGNFVNNIGRYGSGPDEFNKILSFALDEQDRLVVFDEGQMLFKLFHATNGDLLHTFSGLGNTGYSQISEHILFSDGVIYMPVIEQNKLLSETWNSTLLLTFDMEGNVIRSFGQFSDALKKARHFSHRPRLYYDKVRQSIYLGHLPIFNIDKISLKNGDVVSSFGERSENFLIPDSNIDPMMPFNKIEEAVRSQSFVKNITSFEDYVLVHFFNPNERFHQTRDWNEMDHYLKVYDADSHKFLSELSLPFQAIGFTKNGVLLVKDEDPDSFTLAEYEIIESEL